MVEQSDYQHIFFLNKKKKSTELISSLPLRCFTFDFEHTDLRTAGVLAARGRKMDQDKNRYTNSDSRSNLASNFVKPSL